MLMKKKKTLNFIKEYSRIFILLTAFANCSFRSLFIVGDIHIRGGEYHIFIYLFNFFIPYIAKRQAINDERNEQSQQIEFTQKARK